MLGRLLAWLRSGPFRHGDDESGGDSDGSSVWDLTPDWQYGSAGRFQGAGDARAEQESAIEDVERQAEAVDEIETR